MKTMIFALIAALILSTGAIAKEKHEHKGRHGKHKKHKEIPKARMKLKKIDCKRSPCLVQFDFSKSKAKHGKTIEEYILTIDGEEVARVSVPYYEHVFIFNHPNPKKKKRFLIKLQVLDSEGLLSKKKKRKIKIRAGQDEPHIGPTASLVANKVSVFTNEPIIFNSSASVVGSSAIVTRSYILGDGRVIESNETLSATYSVAGNYSITVTLTDENGLTSTATTNLEVKQNQPPVPSFSCVSSAIREISCDASASTDDGTIASYSWSMSDGTTLSGSQVNHSYALGGDKEIILSLTDDKGLSANATQTIAVVQNQNPIANIVCTQNDLSLSCSGITSTDSDGAITSYVWEITTSVGEGPTFNTSAFDFTALESGIVGVNLIVTDNLGGIASSSTELILVDPNFAPVINVSCNSGTIGNLSCDASKSIDYDGLVSSYEWKYENNIIGTESVLNYSFPEGGVKLIVLTITDNGGKSSSQNIDANVVANQAPIITFNCLVSAPLEITCEAFETTDDDGSIANYFWNLGDGNTNSASSFTHTYTEAGVKNISLLVTDNLGAENTKTASLEVFVNQAPMAIIDCSGHGLKLTCDGGSSSDNDGSIASYAWSIMTPGGPGPEFTGSTFEITAPQAFEATITLIVTDNSGLTHEASQVVILSELEGPKAFFKYTIQNGNIDLNYQAENGGLPITSASYEIIQTGEIITLTDFHTANKNEITSLAAGVYDIKLTVGNDQGQTSTFTHNINTQDSNAQAFLGFDLIQSDSNTVFLNAVHSFDQLAEDQTGKNFILQIDWGDGQNSNLDDLFTTHFYSAPGNYDVTINLVSDRGTTTTLTKSVSISGDSVAALSPYANFVVQIIDFNEHATFQVSRSGTANGSIQTYAWDFGDGSIGFGEEIMHLYDEGVYLVTLTVTDDIGMQSTQTQKIIINGNGPSLIVGGGCEVLFDKTVGCNGGGADREGELTGFTLNWGDGSPIENFSPIDSYFGFVGGEHEYSIDGNYLITISVTTSRGEIAQFSNPIEVGTNNGNLFPQVSLNCYVDSGRSVNCDAFGTFDPDGIIANYEWDLGDGAIFNGQTLDNISHEFAADGLYSINLKVTDNLGAESNLLRTITVDTTPLNQPPTPLFVCSVNGYDLLCNASESTDSDGEIVEYLWNFGNNLASTGKVVTHKYAEAGDYQVTLTVKDEDEFSASDSQAVSINALAIGEIACVIQSERTINCQALNLSDPDGTVAKIDWNFADIATSNDLSFTYAFETFGTKAISLLITDNEGQVATITDEVLLIDPEIQPLASFYGFIDHDVKLVKFNAEGSLVEGRIVASYSWNFGDGSATVQSSDPILEKTFDDFGTYNVTLTVTDLLGQTASSTLSYLVANMPVLDPGPINDDTLGGIDSDGDGLRDDVQRAIASLDPAAKSDLEKIAKNWQQNLAIAHTDQTASIALTRTGINLEVCMVTRFGVDKTNNLTKILMVELFNTKDRLMGYVKTSVNFNGEVVEDVTCVE